MASLIKGVNWFGWAWKWRTNGLICPLWFVDAAKAPTSPPKDVHVREGKWVRVTYTEAKRGR